MSKKYKLGDIVIIKSLKWYKENCDACGEVNVSCSFVQPMRKFCGNKGKIIFHTQEGYALNVNGKDTGWEWSDEMLEDIKDIRKQKLNKINEKGRYNSCQNEKIGNS